MMTVMIINLVKIFVNQENITGNMKFAWCVLYVVNVQGIAIVVLAVYDPIVNLASKLTFKLSTLGSLEIN